MKKLVRIAHLLVAVFLLALATASVSWGEEQPALVADAWVDAASLNSLGEVVWSQYDSGTGSQQFFSSLRGQLTTDQASRYSPAVNNMGDMVWSEYSNGYPGGYVLYGRIKGQLVTLANSNNWLGQADINDRGEVVWTQSEDSGASQIHSNLRGQLTSGNLRHDMPSINNRGEVLFKQYDPFQPAPPQIYMISATSTTPVPIATEGLDNSGSAAINDNGEIVWTVRDFANATTQIFSSVRGTVLPAPITAGIFGLDLNSCGDVTYVADDGGMRRLYRLGSNAPCVTHQTGNDSQAEATPVALGDLFTGMVSWDTNNVTDWYRFDATAGDAIHVTANYDSRAPNSFTVGLYDGQGNLLATSQPGTPLSITYPATYSGSYYLKAEGGGARNGYAVSLSKYSENCGVGPCRELLATDVWSGSINSLGEVVWGKYNQEIGAQQFFSSTRGQLPAPAGSSNPAINNLGDMVWSEYSYGYPGGYLLRGTIGGVPVTIANSANYLGEADINDRGEVVWTAADANGFPQIHSNRRGQLTSGTQQHSKPSINNAGDIVFIESDPMQPGPSRILRVAAGSSVPVAVTVEQQSYRAVAVNDSGEMVWAATTYNNGVFAWQIVSSVRGVVVDRVTNDVFTLDLNNCGDIIYSAFDGGMIRLYRFGNSGACGTYQLPNDTQSQAAPVTLGDVFTGVVDSSGSPFDWYRFQANSGDTIYVTVNYDNRAPNLLSVGLYDEQGNLVAPAQGSPLQLKVPAGATGTYYLKAEAVAGRVGYAVSLSKYSENCGAGPCREVLDTDVWSGSINSLGEVVWGKYDQTSGTQLFYSSTRGQSPAPAGSSSPAINNLGDMVWSEYSYGYPGGYLLRGTIGGVPVTIANSANYLGEADINDRGEVVWTATDANGMRQIYSNLRGQLTDGAQQHSKPSINNAGAIVFIESDPMQPGPGRVLRIPGGAIVPAPVTTDQQDYRAVAVNDSGEMVWATTTYNNGVFAWQIVSSVRGVIVDRVTSDIFNVDVNNCGDIIYSTFDGGVTRLYRLGNSGACATYQLPNDTPLQATQVALGDIFTGVADRSGSPFDWYRFEANAGDTIYVTVNYDNRSPNLLSVGLYDGQGNLVAPAQGYPLRFTVPAGTTGTYYLKAEAVAGRVGYAVSLSKYRENCGAGPCRELLAEDVWSGSINSLGEVIWGKYDQASGGQQIYSSTRGQLTFEPGSRNNPAINNLGDLVWSEYSYGYPGGYLIKGTINGMPMTIANSENYLSEVDINDGGEVVWSTADANGVRQVYSNVRGQLTTGPLQHSKPSINNAGDIVFIESDPMQPGPGRIFRLAAGSTVPVAVSTDPQHFRAVAINDNGEIVWAIANFDAAIPGWQFVSSVRGVLLSNRAGNDIFTLDLNNCGDIVYSTFDGGMAKLYRIGNSGGCMAVPERSFSLAVIKSGNGNGEVTSSPAGIALSATDTRAIAAFRAGTPVILTATPDAGSRFVGWMGVVGGSEPSTIVMLGQAAQAVAIFEPKPVDNEAPAVVIGSPMPGISNNNRPELVYAVSDGSVVVRVDGMTVNLVSGMMVGPLADGAHLVRVEATDVAGNVGVAEVSFTVDTVPPALTMNTVATPTSKGSQLVTGTREAGARIFVATDTAAVIGAVEYPTDTTWSFLVSDLQPGYNSLWVSAADAAGNGAATYTGIDFDVVAPTVVIGAPSPETTNSRTPILTYSAGDGTPVVKVDGVTVTKASGDTLGPLSDGLHTVRVEATDAAGNTGFAEVAFTVDATAPTVTITAPTAGLGNNRSPLLGFSVSDGSCLVAVDGVQLPLNSGDTLGPLADGGHAVRVDCRDEAGNTAFAQVSFSVDATAPMVTITAPAAGLTRNNTPVLAYDAGDGSAVVKVDGVVVNKTSGDALAALADGLHVVRVEATDAAGNTGFAEVSFTIDATAPTVTITSPAPGTTADHTPLLLYAVGDGSVVVKVDGAVVNKLSGSSLDALGNGNHTVTVEATDAAGNVGSSTVTFTVAYTPLVVGTASLPFGTTGTPYNVAVSATGGVPGYTWSVVSGSLPDGLTLNGATGAITGVPGAAGSFAFTVKVADSDGASATAAFAISVYQPLQIGTTSLVGGYAGAFYSQSLSASGGAGSYAWSVVSGSLPAGLSLNASTGQIAGIPTSAGSSSFTVECRDGNQTAATAALEVVIEAARPDLVVTAVSGPTSGTKGKKVMLTATVKNQGQAAAAASTLSFYLSTDGTISSADTKVADVPVASIAAGGSQTVSFNATVPATLPTGSYVIGAIADRGGVVAESDETNNTKAGGSIDIR